MASAKASTWLYLITSASSCGIYSVPSLIIVTCFAFDCLDPSSRAQNMNDIVCSISTSCQPRGRTKCSVTTTVNANEHMEQAPRPFSDSLKITRHRRLRSLDSPDSPDNIRRFVTSIFHFFGGPQLCFPQLDTLFQSLHIDKLANESHSLIEFSFDNLPPLFLISFWFLFLPLNTWNSLLKMLIVEEQKLGFLVV